MDGIVMLGGFILLGTGGFWLMRKLDQFLERGGFSSGSVDAPRAKAARRPFPTHTRKAIHNVRPAAATFVTAALPMDSAK